MDKLMFETLRLRLEALTPTLTNDVLEMMQRYPQLTGRYGTGLFGVASQATVAFRDVLLGAVQFRHAGLVTSEMQWLVKLLEARQLNNGNVEEFIEIFRARLSSDLTPEQSAPLLTTINEAVQRLSPSQK